MILSEYYIENLTRTQLTKMFENNENNELQTTFAEHEKEHNLTCHSTGFSALTGIFLKTSQCLYCDRKGPE